MCLCLARPRPKATRLILKKWLLAAGHEHNGSAVETRGAELPPQILVEIESKSLDSLLKFIYSEKGTQFEDIFLNPLS